MTGAAEGEPPRRAFRPGGHPLHPATVHFPLGLLSAGTLWHAIALWQGDAFWWALAFWCLVAGCIGALPAAATGFLEWVALPPRAEVRRIATRHLCAAVLAVVLYTASLIASGGASVPDPDAVGLTVGLSAAGLLCLGLAGWWGGVLVYDQGVAVRSRSGDGC